MLKVINKIRAKARNPSTQLPNIYQAVDCSTVAQSLRQQKDRSSSASIVTDRDLNVISISQSYYDLYGVSPLPLPISLNEIVCARETEGWFALSGAFSDHDALDALLHKVQSNQYFRDFYISPSNEVSCVTHYTDLTSGNKFFTCTPTGINITFKSEESIGVKGLTVLLNLAILDMFVISTTPFESTKIEGQTCAPLICDPKSGRIIIRDEALIFPEISGMQFIAELSLEMKDIVSCLDETGQYSGRVDLEGCTSMQLALQRKFFYAGGPSFLAGMLVKLRGDITTECVQGEYPIFSSKEAEVVCLLAQGNTLKEAAAKVGKAQVTASLQARSALLKSGERSINALVARITNSRLQNF
jgi:hypothetical protein